MSTDKLAEALRNEILQTIKSSGAADPDRAVAKQIINSNPQHVINSSSGSKRLQKNVESRFKLIFSTPTILSGVSAFTHRCVVCNRVISFPCWYYDVKYSVNHFHYFICFNPGEDKPNCSCERR